MPSTDASSLRDPVAMPPLLQQPELFVERSRVWPAGSGLRWALPGVIFLLIAGASVAGKAGGTRLALYMGIMLLAAAGGAAVVLTLQAQLRARLRERRAVEAAGELIQRRRWSDAGLLLEMILSRPMRAEPTRIRALTLLSLLLTRYQRGEQALGVQDALLAEDWADGLTVLTVKLVRATALLREDRLFDADRAIADLRREVARLRRAVAQRIEDLARHKSDLARVRADAAADAANDVGRQAQSMAAAVTKEGAADGDESSDESADPAEALLDADEVRDGQGIVAEASAALSLIEIYRDVKTGHPADALETYQANLTSLRDTLGHRVADAHALAARALDLLGRAQEAATAYQRATLLAPAGELHRRYSELDALIGRFTPAPAPPTIVTLAPLPAAPPSALWAPQGAPGRDDGPPVTLAASTAVAHLRRGIMLGWVWRVALFSLAAALPLTIGAGPRWFGYRTDLLVLYVVVMVAWYLFVSGQRRVARLAALTNGLIAAGATDAAEQHILQVLRSPLLLGAARSLAVYQLALLRQTQRRWRDVALLCGVLLGQGRVRRGPAAVPLRLLLAASSLELDDLATARTALGALAAAAAAGRPLTLSERLRVLGLQLSFHLRIKAWGAVVSALPAKIELAELMPAAEAALAQATMALAAHSLGLADWRDWLVRRAELLADPAQLCAATPALSPLWAPRV